MNEIKELIKKFEDFARTEIQAATKELERIRTEANRRHLQRLVYVNLINRFDTLIDTLLLKFSVLDSEFKRKVLNETREDAVFLKDVYEILLSKDPKTTVEQRVAGVTRAKFLNQRHSNKLRILLQHCFGWKDTDLDRPRVFVNNGSIFTETSRLNPYKVPDTVIGYADWLYSRRNSFVHSDTKKLDKKDIELMKKKFNADVATSISLKISSIKSASKFYTELCKNFIQN